MQLALASEPDFDGWRRQARWLAARGIASAEVHWRINGATSLLDDQAIDRIEESEIDAGSYKLRVPREFVDLASAVILHRSPIASRRFTACCFV